MLENTQEKQQYLRDEILGIGYNPGHFASYLINEREDGDDIDNWSIQSLVDVVVQYKKDNPDPNSTNLKSETQIIEDDQEAQSNSSL